jgi:hypothetical protein
MPAISSANSLRVPVILRRRLRLLSCRGYCPPKNIPKNLRGTNRPQALCLGPFCWRRLNYASVVKWSNTAVCKAALRRFESAPTLCSKSSGRIKAIIAIQNTTGRRQHDTGIEDTSILRGGGTLADLATIYGIKAKTDDALGVVMLNYNQIASPMEEPICQECRALLLEIGSWQVVSRSFFKFFNHGEPNAHPLDWTTARVQEKLDGSLICLYFHREQWQVATKGTPDASGPVNSHAMTFVALVKQTLEEMGNGWEELTARLDPNICYSFELTAPENRIIVPYEDRRLTWLAAWDRQTLAELEIMTLPDLPTPRVREYPLRTLDEVLAAVEAIAPFAAEGFIVRDAAHRRVKIKSASYLMVDRLLGSLSTPRRKVEAMLSEQFDDMVPQLPPPVRDEMLALQTLLAAFRREVAQAFDSLASVAERRDFAREALRYPFSPLLFWLRDGHDMAECFQRLHPDRLVEWLTVAPVERSEE